MLFHCFLIFLKYGIGWGVAFLRGITAILNTDTFTFKLNLFVDHFLVW